MFWSMLTFLLQLLVSLVFMILVSVTGQAWCLIRLSNCLYYLLIYFTLFYHFFTYFTPPIFLFSPSVSVSVFFSLYLSLSLSLTLSHSHFLSLSLFLFLTIIRHRSHLLFFVDICHSWFVHSNTFVQYCECSSPWTESEHRHLLLIMCR